MKLTEIAPKVLNMIKTHRKIKAIDIARKLDIPTRRVYDITILLKALNMIDIENPTNGRGKLYVWRGTQTQGKAVVFNSCKIRVETAGVITRIQNKGTYAILEATRKFHVKNYVDFVNE